MSTLAIAKRELSGTLELLVSNRSRIGEFDWEELVPDVVHLLKRAGEDSLMLAEEVWYDVARRLTRDFIRSRSPSLPDDTAQLALFYEPDALLTLGGREVIAMRDAGGQLRDRLAVVAVFHGHAGASLIGIVVRISRG